PDPLTTSDYVVETLPGSVASAWAVGDDGFIVGTQNNAPARWTPEGALGLLPVLRQTTGTGLSVQVIGGEHWVAGESVVRMRMRATLWRVP
ncbi:MAG TPA: hypothetical protein VEB59_15770, partial [Gemmatimonadales bacterium]|nr:hypothetical protein [Gemmatimonadales bacterium]